MNWQVFRTRALTALVFVVVMMTGLLVNYTSFFILFTIIHFGCWVEYQQLIGRIHPSYREISFFHRYGVMVAGWAWMLYCTGNDLALAGINFSSVGLALGLVFAFALPLIEILFSQQFNLKHIGFSALGLLYISLSWGLLVNIRSLDPLWPFGAKNDLYAIGFLIPFIIIFSIWINDTMAYIVGSLIGKTTFSKVSPKKTLEGTIGGAILCIVAMCSLATAFGLPVLQVGVIAAIAALIGTAGDLLESKLKRMAGVKDSGHFMPGHGGFLDRFDSLVLTVPVVWLYIMLVIA